MQVSWIDPEEIRALANQLLDPLPSKAKRPPEVQRLPDPASLASAPLIDTSFEPAATRLPSAELEQIRAKLRHIRDRAKSAGLLSELTSPPAPAPVAVAPALPPEPEPEYEPKPKSAPLPAAEVAPPPADETPAEIEAEVSPASPDVAPIPALFQPEDGTIADRLNQFSLWATEQTSSDEFLVLDHHGDILWGVPSREDLVVQSLLLLHRGTAENGSPFDALRTTTSKDKQLTVWRVPTRYGEVILVSLAGYSPDEQTLTLLRNSLTLTIDEARVD